MRYNPIGKTGLFVSEFGIGTMLFAPPPGRYSVVKGLEPEVVEKIVRKAIDAGVNLFDTANVYSVGQSEANLGATLKTLGINRHDVVLATKAAHAMGDGPNDFGTSRYHLNNQVEASLKRLGTDHIDIFQLHGFDTATSIEETVRALDDLVHRGMVRYVGVSNWAAWQIAEALQTAGRINATRFHSVQAYYSLVGRDIEREIVPMVEASGLGLMVWSPLAGGYLSGKYRNGDGGRRAAFAFPPVDERRGDSVLSAMDGIADAHQVALGTLALAWLLHQPAVSSVILGVSSLGQLEENLKAGALRLSSDDLKVLNEASALPPEYPGWMFTFAETRRKTLFESGQLKLQH